MKFSDKPTIELLEARIAPARLIITGVPNGISNGFDVDYLDTTPADDALLIDTEVAIAQGDTKIAEPVGGGVIGRPDTHYLRMSKGDVLVIFNESTGINDPFLTVKSGNLVALFVDKDLDNEVDEGELTGIALGQNASIILKSGVDGDIVANLNELGTSTLTDDVLEMNALSVAHNIVSLQITGGGVGGSIIAGGNISNILANGTVGAILAGTAAHTKTIDFFPGITGGDGVLSIQPAAGKAGSSIKNITVDGLGTPGSVDPFNGILQAGGGGAGGKGGTVTFVQVTEDADGMTIRGGAGGGGTTGKGGAGGAVTRVFISGFPDATAESVVVEGGAGGLSPSSTGGAGGLIKDVFVGYRLFGGKPFASDTLLKDQIAISGGAGGAGKVGGLGGGVTNADVRVETAEAAGDEISVKGGTGGANTVAGGKAGGGGNLANIILRNQDLGLGAAYTDTLIQAGSAGTALATSKGGAGGNVSKVTLLGWQHRVIAGSGSDGKVGGAGGSINSVLVEESDDILAAGAQFDAGVGGDASAGAGGRGGNINGIFFENSDLADFIINSGFSANGGNASGGKGGLGGYVQNVNIADSDVSNGATQTSLQPLTVRTGDGGAGTKGGGAGGNLKGFVLDSTNVSAQLFTGKGGNVEGIPPAGQTVAGKGGAGGSFENIAVTTRGLVGAVPAPANAFAGVGGNGAGNNGSGGAGGNLKTVTVVAAGVGELRAGQGGDGQTTQATIKGGAAGKGGSITVSQLTAAGGDGTLRAGDAGVNGAKPGIGGGIVGLNNDVRAGLFARDNLTVQAGKGSNGGAGGDVRFLGYGSAVVTLSPTPAGNITINAGDGGDSTTGNVAGLGGSIKDVSGAISSPDLLGTSFTTSFKAGDGGSSPGRGAVGGSVQDVIMLSGGFDGAIVTVQAGDAGDATTAKTGAKGGDVKNVTLSSVDLATIFRSVAAGDGGDALTKGGAGGNVENIFVDSIDIGARTDVPFGFAQMGGIFAGAPGKNLSTNTFTSASGKVTTVVAKGIAAIVAGRDLIPQPAESVDNIILSGSNRLLREVNVFTTPGSFRLAFTTDTAAVATAEGTVASPEVQTLTLAALQDADVDLVLGFGADSTTVLAGTATAAEIQTALNALASIQAAGGVTVVADALQGFTITFNSNGDQVGVITAEATEETGVLPPDATAGDVATALNGLATIQFETGSPTGTAVTGANGSFIVTYQVNGDVLPLDGVEVFSSNLTELVQGSVTTDVSTELTPGLNGLVVTEVLPGQQTVPVFEDQPGSLNSPERQSFNVDNVLNVPNLLLQMTFTGTFATQEVVAGDTNLQERQNFDVAAIRTDAAATFTLSYNGFTTSPLASNATAAQIQAALNALPPMAGAANQVTVTAGIAPEPLTLMKVVWNQAGARTDIRVNVTSATGLLAPDSTEAQFETALNALASVKVTGANEVPPVTGTVDVANLSPTAFSIQFVANGDQQMVNIQALAPEVQEIDHSVLDASPTATFTLSFDRTYQGTETTKGGVGTREVQRIEMGSVLGSTTSTFQLFYNNRVSAVLPGNATNTQIQTAINQMGIGQIQSVTIVGGTLQITFQAFGDQASLFSATATSTTAALAATATDADVQTALNALPTLRGPAVTPDSVTVTTQPDGDFEVVFSTRGQRAPIVAGVLAQETQTIDVSAIQGEATGSFRLQFGPDQTVDLLPNATEAEVLNALNSLAAIQAAGGVSTVTLTGPGVYDVQFTALGDRLPIQIEQGIDEVQEVDFAAGKPVTLTVDRLVTAVEVPGASGVPEVQVLTMGAILGSSAAEFTVTFDNGVDPAETTISLPGTATEAEIQNAINALPVLATAGNLVTVQTDATTIQITFQIDGDQPGVFTAQATQSTAPLAPNASATDIETALNALATVQSTGDNGAGGTVSVVVGGGSDFEVRYNASGDQVLIGATQEQPLVVTTIRPGQLAVQEQQAFSPLASGQPITAAYQAANLIGFFADHTEIDATVFHFIHNGVPTDATVQDFVPGDQPIDGLIFAKKINQARLSVTPEAYRVGPIVGGIFFDWNNII